MLYIFLSQKSFLLLSENYEHISLIYSHYRGLFFVAVDYLILISDMRREKTLTNEPCKVTDKPTGIIAEVSRWYFDKCFGGFIKTPSQRS